MVQYPSRYDQVERPPQLACALERQLPDFEVFQVVLPFQPFGVLDARRADVDTDDTCVGTTQRVLGCLPGTASSNEDVEIGAIRFGRPEQVMLRTVAIRIAPFVARAIEVLDRWRIGVTRVE